MRESTALRKAAKLVTLWALIKGPGLSLELFFLSYTNIFSPAAHPPASRRTGRPPPAAPRPWRTCWSCLGT